MAATDMIDKLRDRLPGKTRPQSLALLRRAFMNAPELASGLPISQRVQNQSKECTVHARSGSKPGRRQWLLV